MPNGIEIPTQYFRAVIMGPDIYDIYRAAGESWTNRGEPSGPSYAELISQAQETILLLVVDPRRSLGETSVLGEVASKLQKGVSIQIILCDPGWTSKEEVENQAHTQIPEIAELKTGFSEHLRLFFVGRRARFGFAVVDTEHTLLEEPDVVGRHPQVFIVRDRKWANEWKDHFNQIKDTGQEIL